MCAEKKRTFESWLSAAMYVSYVVQCEAGNEPPCLVSRLEILQLLL